MGMNEDKGERRTARRFLRPLVVMVIATVMFYLLVYQYETGYASYFYVPNQLMELTLQGFIRPLPLLLYVVLLLLAAIIVYSNVISRLASLIDRTIMSRFSKNKQASHYDDPRPKLVSVIVLLGFVVLVCILSGALGKYKASTETRLWVIKESGQNYAVMSMYQDYMVLVPVDLSKWTFKPEYRLVKPESLKQPIAYKEIERPLVQVQEK